MRGESEGGGGGVESEGEGGGRKEEVGRVKRIRVGEEEVAHLVRCHFSRHRLQLISNFILLQVPVKHLTTKRIQKQCLCSIFFLPPSMVSVRVVNLTRT